jgi:hypothetical protein
MGVDIKAIAGHEFQKQDILELPSRIDTWSDIEWPGK